MNGGEFDPRPGDGNFGRRVQAEGRKLRPGTSAPAFETSKQAAERIASMAKAAMELIDQHVALTNKVRKSDDDLSGNVDAVLSSGSLKMNHSYVTPHGVLTLFQDQEGPRTMLLPIGELK